MKLFFDGGVRGTPPVMEVAVVARGQATTLPDLGPGTSGDAEWLALIHAATLARSLGATDVVLVGDCADVIAKAGGRMRARAGDAAHLARFRVATAGLARLRLRWVKRSRNLAGIALARAHPRG